MSKSDIPQWYTIMTSTNKDFTVLRSGRMLPKGGWDTHRVGKHEVAGLLRDAFSWLGVSAVWNWKDAFYKLWR
jgi:hypothetical protein